MRKLDKYFNFHELEFFCVHLQGCTPVFSLHETMKLALFVLISWLPWILIVPDAMIDIDLVDAGPQKNGKFNV